ncbi:MAG: DNA recombination protein RmuC [Bacteroidales bacterium]|nr:DNA recombination protein RmuC [Bacteroidales bacterium]MBO7646667.1 DNA recombination protein RmuC [Bacteroidales bacterium]
MEYSLVIVIISAIAGIVLGSLVVGLILRSKNSIIKANLESANTLLEEVRSQAQSDLQDAKKEYEKRLADMKTGEQEHYKSLLEAKDEANKKAMETLKSHYEESLAEQKKSINDTLSRIATDNKAATEEMLKARQKEFAETSATNIGQIVDPLKETIKNMEQAMQNSSKDVADFKGAMEAQLKQMINQSVATQKTTEELTNAFKHKSKLQGNWGETVLTELLELQGLTKGVHFDTQAPIRDSKGTIVKNEDGSTMIPDVILHLDQKREVIIDSKVSLTAFFDFVNADTEEERQQRLKAHISSLNQHVAELSKKDYSSYIQPPKVRMDYVIMFVPHTGALWTALNSQPDLWRKAMEKNVFIADEQSLYAALQIIRMTWTQIKQAQNHELVYKLAGEMIDRVGLFMKNYDDVGNALKKAQTAFDDGKKKLVNKGKSIIVSANNLIKIGVKQSPKNPIPTLEDIDEAVDTALDAASDEMLGLGDPHQTSDDPNNE